MMNKGKVIIFSAPSGSGKTTIIRHLLLHHPNLKFSVSATSRAPRGNEVCGTDYHFMSSEEFSEAVSAGKFIEWEEVYAGTCYGTLHSEVERLWQEGTTVLFDVDVVGGIRLKEHFGSEALSLFIMPPSIEELTHRLTSRGTDTAEQIEKRIAKAQIEIAYAEKFDKIIINDILEVAQEAAETSVVEFLTED